jgi:hypothetical protein
LDETIAGPFAVCHWGRIDAPSMNTLLDTVFCPPVRWLGGQTIRFETVSADCEADSPGAPFCVWRAPVENHFVVPSTGETLYAGAVFAVKGTNSR